MYSVSLSLDGTMAEEVPLLLIIFSCFFKHWRGQFSRRGVRVAMGAADTQTIVQCAMISKKNGAKFQHFIEGHPLAVEKSASRRINGSNSCAKKPTMGLPNPSCSNHPLKGWKSNKMASRSNLFVPPHDGQVTAGRNWNFPFVCPRHQARERGHLLALGGHYSASRCGYMLLLNTHHSLLFPALGGLHTMNLMKVGGGTNE